MWHVIVNVVCHWALICCGNENDIIVNNTNTREKRELRWGPKRRVNDYLKIE